MRQSARVVIVKFMQMFLNRIVKNLNSNIFTEAYAHVWIEALTYVVDDGTFLFNSLVAIRKTKYWIAKG